MPKQYVKFRVGFLDHLPMFASNPDALVLYNYALLMAPMSGPEAGCVRISQSRLADAWEWDRGRVSRAVKWLLNHPAPSHPLLILVERGRRNQPGRYVIPRFETSENNGRFVAHSQQKRPGFVADSAAQAQRIHEYVADSAALTQRNRNIRNARVRKNENKKNQEEGYAVYEHADWITVRTEAEAREALRLWRGYGQLPDTMQEQAIDTAMKNLEFYRIRYDVDDDEQVATG